MRPIAFRVWAAVLVIVFGLSFFSLISLLLAWFETVEGVAGPVTELRYGALVGIIFTSGLLVQLHAPERKIAGMQQAALVTPALLIASVIASDSQNVVPALISLAAVGSLLALHPDRAGFLQRDAALSPKLLAIAFLGAMPLTAYALDMGAQARDLAGPPHHVQRLSTMAAMAIGITLVGALAGLQTRGSWIPAWSAGTATVVFGCASTAFPDHPGAAGRTWGVLAISGGVLFIAVAELEGRRRKQLSRVR